MLGHRRLRGGGALRHLARSRDLLILPSLARAPKRARARPRALRYVVVVGGVVAAIIPLVSAAVALVVGDGGGGFVGIVGGVVEFSALKNQCC
eukprot:3267392-Pyramimonas_sp.AAC.1